MWWGLKLSIVLVVLSPKCFCSAKLEHYFELDFQLMTQLKSYSVHLQSHIGLLNRYINDRRARLADMGNDREEYLGNPVNSYSLLHRLHFDWPRWRKLMEKPLATEQITEMRELLTQIPTKQEFMNSTREALDFHNKQNHYVEENKFQLRPTESLDIALYAYDHENFEEAEVWLNKTLEGHKHVLPQQKELYEVISPVSKSQIEDLYEKVQKMKRVD
ncbi:prolyl 4-hydroxylase subunit alpha-2-like [Drosophila ficusphila]|uniref:prolyl 4-hydroxylase subunit alpha-2-like n=1 Tax=Drosophila ficusphila TaxID=30025 RepID=UPI0007E8B424|nr:prolyl 4-hydroxylase subunit alpha-2-like [Drosophila ficusphila]